LKMISNKRQTQQKVFLADYLSTHFDHPTAKELYDIACKSGIKIGLTSVYRLCEEMTKSGQLVPLLTPDGQIHYDWKRAGHYHFICTECGKIIDVPLTQAAEARFAQSSVPFEIVSTQAAVLYGRCLDCQKKHK
jgi:Fur family peroxide stress response transcriptional regulator